MNRNWIMQRKLVIPDIQKLIYAEGKEVKLDKQKLYYAERKELILNKQKRQCAERKDVSSGNQNWFIQIGSKCCLK
jgi:hypothetical protein